MQWRGYVRSDKLIKQKGYMKMRLSEHKTRQINKKRHREEIINLKNIIMCILEKSSKCL